MEREDWADEQLSQDLPVLRARGENQDLEYIEAFPTNVRELAKEIAAFATSNTGTILLGVSNSGDLVGLETAHTAAGRDELLRRLEGICKGPIKPSITPSAKYAVESGTIVLVITVPKGHQPIYYSNNIPYLRHITESRPAEPHEVIELIERHRGASIGSSDSDQVDPRTELYSQLARILVEVLVYCDEVRERNVNPWLEMWRSGFRYAANELRDLALQDLARAEGIHPDLNTAADALDAVADLRLHLGVGPELTRLVTAAQETVTNLKAKYVDSIPLGDDSLAHIKGLIIASSRKLDDMVSRSETMLHSGRREELQNDTSALGLSLLRVSHYAIDPLGAGIREKLHSVGRDLHLVETARIHIDGGASLRAIGARISAAADGLRQIVDELSR